MWQFSEVIDGIAEQRQSVRDLKPPPSPALLGEPARWAHYPWRRSVVHVLGPESFRLARLDRNRNKIEPDEQDRLCRLKVGIVGLSVGHAIAHVLALEGLCGELRLADFDTIEVPNLNRLPVTVLDLGLNKAVAAARRIAELDPYLPVAIFPEGVCHDNIDAFMDGLDVVVEECDSLDVKLLVREAARERAVPVLMVTSDRGLFDVERFDLEPERPPFHGLLGDVTLSINASGLVEGLVADSTFFRVDSAQLSPLGIQIVDTSGRVLSTYANSVDVAGYTDDQPITGGPYANNWELSAARATSVVERLTGTDDVEPTRVVALAYGQYHPVVPNTSPAALAENRRVNIVVKREPSPSGKVTS